LSTGGSVYASNLVNPSNTAPLQVTSANSLIQFDQEGTTFEFPTGYGNTTHDICVSGVSCATGTGAAVILQPSTAQADDGSLAGIFINDINSNCTLGTNCKDLVDLQNGGSDVFTVDQYGNAQFDQTLYADTIQPISGAGGITVGTSGTSQSFTLQGNSGSEIEIANPDGGVSYVGVQSPSGGTPSSQNVYYALDDTQAPSSGTNGGNTAANPIFICTSANSYCTASSGITGTGATGNIALFNGTHSLTNSILNQSSSNITIAGSTGTSSLILGNISSTSSQLVFNNGSNSNSITITQPASQPSSKINVSLPSVAGTIAVAGSGLISVSNNGTITCTSCASTGSGGTGASTVTSLNGLQNAVDITDSLNNVFGTNAQNVQIPNASTSALGLVQIASDSGNPNLSINGSGVLDTVQGIQTSSSPQFSSLYLGSIGPSGNDGQLVFYDGSSNYKLTLNQLTLTNNQTIHIPNNSGTLIVAVGSSSNLTLNNGVVDTANAVDFPTSVTTSELLSGSGSLQIGSTSSVQPFTLNGAAGTSGSYSSLDLYSGSYNTKIDFASPATGNNVYTFPDADGISATVCVQNTGSGYNSCDYASGLNGTGNPDQVAYFSNTSAISSGTNFYDNGSTVGLGGISSGFGTHTQLTVNTNATAINNAATQLNSGTSNPTYIPLVVEGASSQSADLLDIDSNAGTPLAGFNSTGNLYFSGSSANTITGANNENLTLQSLGAGQLLLNSAGSSLALQVGGTTEASLSSAGNFNLPNGSYQLGGSTTLSSTALTFTASTDSITGPSGSSITLDTTGSGNLSLGNTNAPNIYLGNGNSTTTVAGKLSQSYSSPSAGTADTFNFTNSNSAAGVAIQGISLTPANTTPSSGTNTLNILNFVAGSGVNATAITNGINFASSTGYSNFINAPNFAVGSNGTITLGTVGTTEGQITFSSSHSGGSINLEASTLQANSSDTISFPTVTGNDTVCLKTTANCTVNGTGGSDFINNTPGPTQQTNANIDIQSATSDIAVQVQGATGQHILDLWGGSQTYGVGNPDAYFDANGNLSAGTINGATITSSSFNGATISGGTLSGSSLSATQLLFSGASGTVTTNSGDNLTIDTGGGSSTLNLGNTNATAIQIGNSNFSSGSQTINIGNNNTSGGTTNINIGNGSSALGTVAIQGGNITLTTAGSGTTTISNIYNNTGTGTALKDNVSDIQNGSTGSSTVNADTIGLTGNSTTGETINLNGINFANVSAIANNTFNGLYFGTGYNNAIQGAGALNITGAGASTWDIGNYTLSLQTLSNGPITTGAGLFTLGGNVALSAASPKIYSSTSNSGLTVQANGTGTLTLNSSGTSGTIGAIQIGNASTASVTQSIYIGNNNGASSVSNVTVGSTLGASSLALQAGTGNLALTTGTTTGNITLTTNNASSGIIAKSSTNSATAFQVENTGNTSLLTVDTSGNNVTIDNSGAAGTVQIGNTTGAVTQNVYIGNNSTTSSTNNVTVGSTIGASSLTLQGGTGNIQLSTGNVNSGVSGNINIQTGNSTGTSGNITIDTGSNVPSGTLLLNRTFEDGLTDNMSNWYNTTIANSTAKAHTGTHSLAVTVTTTASWGVEELWPGVVPVTPGHNYNFTAWFIGGTYSDNISLTAVFDNGSIGVGSSVIGSITDNTSTWTEISGTATAPAGSTYVYFTIGSSGTAGEVQYIDDMTVTDTTSTYYPAINIGTTNAQTIVIGNSSQTGATNILGGSDGINIGTGLLATSQIQIGSTSTTNSQVINIGNNSVGSTLTTIGSTHSGSTTTLQAGTATESLSGTGVTIANSTNSSTAFQVQNASSNPQLLINNSATSNLIMYPSFTSGSFTSASTGWAAVSPGTITQNTTAADSYDGVDSLKLTTTSSNGGADTTDFTSTLTSTTYYVSFYVMPSVAMNANAFTITLYNGTTNYTCTPSSQTLSLTGFTRVSCSIAYTSGASSTLTIAQTDSTARTIYISDVQLQTTGVTNYQLGTLSLPGTTITSPTIFQNASNSSTAFQVQNTSGATLLGVDTNGNNVNVGTNGATVNLGVVGSTATASTVNIANTSGNATQQINIGSTGSANNAVLIQGGTTSSAISLQTGTNGDINIGNSEVANNILIGNASPVAGQVIVVGTSSSGSSVNDIAFGSTGSTFTTYNETGNTQTYTVPNGVTQLEVNLYGAAGGDNSTNGLGGYGGETQGTVSVTPGEVLTIIVGGVGGNNSGTNNDTGGAGGYGGGGSGGTDTNNDFDGGGGGGGGATQILNGSTELAIAAGGGGGGYFNAGGAGGGLIGGAGFSYCGTNTPGGTQTAGGTACANGNGNSGSEYTGGAGGAGATGDAGAGGGGGYYGGAGGAGNDYAAGGGGGSALVPSGGTTTSGVESGNGQAIITPLASIVQIQSGATSETLATTGATIQTTTNSSTAFQIDNSNGTTLLGVDTSGTNINLGVTGTTAVASTVNIANTSGNATQQINIGSTGSANNAVLIQGGTTTSAISLQTGTNGDINIGNSEVTNNIIIGNASPVAGQVVVVGTSSTGSSVNDIAFGSTASTFTTYNETGNTQTYTVPNGVTQLKVTLYGAAGGVVWGTSAAYGGETQGVISVTPGEVLTIIVGGVGSPNNVLNGGAGGYGGGGAGGTSTVWDGGAGGGGASEILNGGTVLAVAGGGGGGGYYTSAGSGGGTTGGNGYSSGGSDGGSGGTQSGGGAGGGNGTAGSSLTGGTGGNNSRGGGSAGAGGGGGGGGYYGGGGGGYDTYGVAGAGGGGSAYVPAGGTTTSGVESGNGQATITPLASIVQIQSGATSETLATTGDTIQTTTNSSTAFQVQNASGTSILTADTTNSRIDIGTNGTATGQLYVSGTVPTYVGENSDTNLSDPQSVYVSGNFAYVTNFNNNELVVYNISSGTPVYVGESNTNLYDPEAVYVQGNYAYVVNNGDNNLVVFNISSGTPVYVGANSDSHLVGPISVYVQGNYAYVTSGNSGSNSNLVVYNISSGTPVYVGENSDSNLNAPTSVYVQGNYAYVTSGTNGSNSNLVVYNISSGTPVYVSENSDTYLNHPFSVYVQGNYAYVASFGSNKLVVYNISSGTPVYVSENTDSYSTNSRSVSVQGNYAYLVSSSGKLVIYNISSGTPVYVGENTDSAYLSSPIDVYIQGNYAYVICIGNNELVTYSLGGTYSQSLQAGSIQSGTLAVTSDTNIGGELSVQGGISVGTGEEVQGTLGVGGSATFENTTNSTSALQVQNASGYSLLGVDTTGTDNDVIIGQSSKLTGNLLFANASNSYTFSLTASTAATANIALILPSVAPTAGQCLTATSSTQLAFGGCSTSHTKQITLTAEYAGAVLDSASDSSCSSANIGSMTSGYNGTDSSPQSYYQWSTAQSSSECYDVVVEVPIPSDWSSWTGTPTIYASSGTGGSIAVAAIASNGSEESNYGSMTGGVAAYHSETTTGSLAAVSLQSLTSASDSANGVLTLKIRMTATSSANTEIGTIIIPYTSSY
jgi:hypothetical protein